ncbi:MAG TPA: response regulator [Opitutaceae bacterium]|nr:response regulator [Opitutaceae bacterium]
MTTEPRFLVIDDNAESRMLLVKTLLRKFPDGVVSECQHAETAVKLSRGERLSAIVAHRTFDHDGAALIRLLRRANPSVPLIMVSGQDQSVRAKLAGADAFLDYDAWLQIGSVVSAVIDRKAQPPPAPAMDGIIGLAPAQ